MPRAPRKPDPGNSEPKPARARRAKRAAPAAATAADALPPGSAEAQAEADEGLEDAELEAELRAEAAADADPDLPVAEYKPVFVKKAPPLPGQKGSGVPADLAELGNLPVPELVRRLRFYGLTVHEGIDRAKLLVMFMRAADRLGLNVVGEGLLEILPDGYGFLRSLRNGFLPASDDLYVSPGLLAQTRMRAGMTVRGRVQISRRKEKFFPLGSVDSLNEFPPAEAVAWKTFDELTPLFPDRRILLETASDPRNFPARVVDLVAPIGFGQRGLIVSPPRAGKTMMLKALGNAIAANYPKVKLLVFLVDERPEEITDMRRSIRGEVIASSFDESPQRHIAVADRVYERMRSLVEAGHDVVVLLDSLTRLGRAYNAVARSTGRILSGGIEANALQKPKRFFGSARNIEKGGSLTILATALVETNSRMDEVIFEEFKGTGNMEIVLSRAISEQRIFPAIDLNRSGTRMDSLLYDPDEARLITALRTALADLPPVEAIEKLLERLKRTASNVEFLLSLGTRRF